MAIEVFNRFEYKYQVDEKILGRILETIEEHMNADKYCNNHSMYTIANIYYDTDDDILIRRSLSKPKYKEKLRLRSYGIPHNDSRVYLEIKKKFDGLVNKRRTALYLDEAYNFLKTHTAPVLKPHMNKQVVKEIEYFLNLYNLEPKVYIAYDRLAYFERNNDDLRVSFDTNIRSRRTDLRLEDGDHGILLLPKGMYLMEIKTSTAIPIWLTEILSKYELKRTSFSKYGTEFKRYIAMQQMSVNKFII